MTVRDVVNVQDEIIGVADKEEFGKGNLICRVAFVMLVNSKGELLLHQRNVSKRAYPLYWSGSAAGHLVSGETYDKAATRELIEELGVLTPLEFVGKFYSPEDREMVGVFLGFHDGPLNIEEAEVERVEYFSREKLELQRPSMKITSFVDRSLPLVADRLGWH